MLRKTLLAIAFIAATTLSQTGVAASLGYDPQADPFEQYHQAVASAKAEGKLVLIIAGGDWCTWCHVLNKFVSSNDDVQRSLEDAFVVMKVYVGDENYNQDFFSQLPAARGAPHFWIVSPDKQVLASQSTGAFEHGRRGYDKGEFLAFVGHWKQLAGSRGR
jgi:thiol:disulfide interchange protein